jgi:excisionase family DNA binding protein
MNTSSITETDQPTFSREDLLTADEVAEVLRLKRATALDYMRRGVIPAFKLGRRWYSLRPRLDAYLASASRPSGPS